MKFKTCLKSVVIVFPIKNIWSTNCLLKNSCYWMGYFYGYKKCRQFIVFVYQVYGSIPERCRVVFGFYLVITTENSFCLMNFSSNLIPSYQSQCKWSISSGITFGTWHWHWHNIDSWILWAFIWDSGRSSTEVSCHSGKNFKNESYFLFLARI